jgi:uncharacterized protein YycO
MTSRPFILFLLALVTGCSDAVEVRDGDIIFHRSQSRQAKAIAAATKSDYTHMGIIFFSDGKPFVYEAIQPVKRTPLDEWIDRGVGGHYVIKRLKSSDDIDFSKVKEEVRHLMGRDYDWLFEWSDSKVYCSELVWKAYERGADIKIGSLKKLKDFDLSSPEVRQIMRERYGNKIPIDMDVIAPSDMFNSDQLRTVIKK